MSVTSRLHCLLLCKYLFIFLMFSFCAYLSKSWILLCRESLSVAPAFLFCTSLFMSSTCSPCIFFSPEPTYSFHVFSLISPIFLFNGTLVISLTSPFYTFAFALETSLSSAFSFTFPTPSFCKSLSISEPFRSV
jgi:hypothetical protein